MNRYFVLARVVMVAALASSAAMSRAYEVDVHYGLTRWLALRAGFSEPQAEAIALGDQRIDGGMVATMTLNLEYACAGRFADVARNAQHAHFPSATSVPALPAARIVRPGDPSARIDLARVTTSSKGKEGAMLGKLGEALHPLQDSWAHQGTPSALVPGASIDCDATLASGPPAARGGSNPHVADLTSAWPDDTVAMARATYDELVRYGAIDGRPRIAASWESLNTPLTAFAQARTKSAKRAWFTQQGLRDTRFLEGISLPDGNDAGPLDWTWRQLPPPPGTASMQHDAPADVRAFFDSFLARWLGDEPVERVVAAMGSGPQQAELAARLRLWKVRDHGAAADLAHSVGPFTPAQLKAVARIAHDPASAIRPMTVMDALLPLQPSTPAPMPMLPYVVETLPTVAGRQRMVALARLRHAPYDSVGWVIERRGDHWALIEMIAAVDP